jgi:uncharacterized protein
MKRIIDLHLRQWKNDPRRKPTLLRGARQVGKTFSVRKLGQTFESYVEINLERRPELKKIFEVDLIPQRIIRDLIAVLKKEIVPGKTLLFIDEIQEAPQAIISLRYFYEEMPDLHVIAAGSLLDFAIQQVGVPVGRVSFLYLYPMSWLEFLIAQGNDLLLAEILKHDPNEPMNEPIHQHTLRILSEYLVVGGMPEAVFSWIQNKNPLACAKIHQTILEAYRQDFHKYAKENQIKYVDHLFEHGTKQLGRKFKFSDIPGEYRKRELSPALDMLSIAGVVHHVYHSSGQGIPLGAEVDLNKFKLIYLDIGLTQAALGLNLADWFLNSNESFINKGTIVEGFVGQEILAYSNPNIKASLYYWQREERGSQAEIDYLIQKQGKVIPIEVKSNKGTHLKSMNHFLESHPKSPYGMRFSNHDYSIHNRIHSYPLYAIASALGLTLEDISD